MKKLTELEFYRDFVDTFEGDDSGNLEPRQTPGMFYSKAIPTSVSEPALLAWSDDLSSRLGIEKPLDQQQSDVLGGNKITDSMYPYAACYAGHQFGNWAGQLGDGRAITLGEIRTPENQIWDLQLKGAGPTAYSRRADGRAVLRSSVREYLMSEAMFYLGVPTTRALSLVSTGDKVMRDMFYNGNAAYEPGAVVMRASPSFLRFGSFEMPAARNEIENLKKLCEWTIEKFYPHIQGDNQILKWFTEIVERTAKLMVEWLRVGFVHGVMNTDNMSILGLTIDYGPFSFLDDYDPDFTPNTTDLPGRRYAYGKQASIGYWNIGCLANALSPLFSDTAPLVAAVETYEDIFWMNYYAMMGKKLGLDSVNSEDIELINQVEQVLASVKPDMTIFYQLLMELPDKNNNMEIFSHFKMCFYGELTVKEKEEFLSFIINYQKRIESNSCTYKESREIMRKANPRFVLRNYLLHQAIEELEKGEQALFSKLQKAIKEPYSNAYDEFFVIRPDWATQQPGCSMLSCSS